MKVSIITVTLNSAEYLEDCIASVVKQRYPDIEHIIIDGGSTDRTLSIIKQYERHIARWISEPDRGMYDAINKGMALATGDVIGILNSDDMLENEYVITDIAEAFTTKKVDAVFADLEFVDRQDSSKVLRVWKGRPFKRERFRYGWMPAHPTFYIKRQLVELYGGYESHYFTAADYEFMARYLFKFKISAYYLPKLVVKMRMGGQSNRSIYQRLRANRRDYLAMKKNKIPFPFLVSILKPLGKLHQWRR